jgi:hypothetical protein
MKTVIFDMYQTVYSYSDDFDIERSNAIYNEHLARYPGLREPEAERESVLKGLGGDPTELQVFEIPGALECISSYANDGYTVVFVSSSEVETTTKILTFLSKRKEIKLDLGSFVICSFVGRKDNVKEWKSILGKFKNITDIYDDKPSYLKASSTAAKELGSNPKTHLSIKS